MEHVKNVLVGLLAMLCMPIIIPLAIPAALVGILWFMGSDIRSDLSKLKKGKT